jgi:ParB family chromosome partitioning protein
MTRSASGTTKNPDKKLGLSRSKNSSASKSLTYANSHDKVDGAIENEDAVSSALSPQAEISTLPNQQLTDNNEVVELAASPQAEISTLTNQQLADNNDVVELAPSNQFDLNCALADGAAKLFATPLYPTQKSVLLPPSSIVLPKSQPRRYFDKEKLQSLTDSVRRDGILQPILVRPNGDDKYELVAGERRLRAAHAAGLKEIPVFILDLDETSAAQYALVENLLREDLNPFDEAEGILQLLELRLDCDRDKVTALLYKMDNASRNKITGNVLGSQDAFVVFKVFEELGTITWQSFIRTRLPLLDLQADVLEALRGGQIEYTKALSIGKVKSDVDRAELLESTISLDLSLKEIRAEIKKYNPTSEKASMQTRMENTYKLFKKSKAWDSPELRDKLSPLLEQMEVILGVEL